MEGLRLDEVTTGYGETEVLHDLSAQIESDRVNCIIGPNGSGKSTCLKAISGLIPVWSGSISVNGQDITDDEPWQIIEKGVVQLPQGSQVFPDLTVRENLRVGAYLLDDSDHVAERYDYVYDLFPVLEEREDTRAKSLSGGQQAMVAMGRALMPDPEFLLLDEPSAGLAPDLVDEVFGQIEHLKDAGVDMVIVEQNVRKVLEIAEYVYVFEQGELAFDGEADEFRDRDQLMEMYLGRRRE
jgi:branched-chain amino acid transport system ATP-binding protein